MVVEYRTGDLFAQDDVEAIGHGVNCRGLMGSGIAVAFRRQWPSMYEAYRELCEKGELSGGMVWPWKAPEGKWIFNIASQEEPGPNADLKWLQTGVAKALVYCEKNGIKSLALPRIGSGVGGLYWEDVRVALEGLAQESPVRLVVVTYGEEA